MFTQFDYNEFWQALWCHYDVRGVGWPLEWVFLNWLKRWSACSMYPMPDGLLAPKHWHDKIKSFRQRIISVLASTLLLRMSLIFKNRYNRTHLIIWGRDGVLIVGLRITDQVVEWTTDKEVNKQFGSYAHCDTYATAKHFHALRQSCFAVFLKKEGILDNKKFNRK